MGLAALGGRDAEARRDDPRELTGAERRAIRVRAAGVMARAVLSGAVLTLVALAVVYAIRAR